MAISPGGRPADDSPLAKPGYTGPRRLVNYVRMIAHALMRKGVPKGRAIGMARGILRNWAEGKGDVSPKVRAAAAKALAEQEALDKKNRVAKADQSHWNFEQYQEIAEQLDTDIMVAKTRRVRTPEGARFFDLPIGSPITAEAVAAAKAKHGGTKVDAMLHANRRGEVKRNRQQAKPNGGIPTPKPKPNGGIPKPNAGKKPDKVETKTFKQKDDLIHQVSTAQGVAELHQALSDSENLNDEDRRKVLDAIQARLNALNPQAAPKAPDAPQKPEDHGGTPNVPDAAPAAPPRPNGAEPTTNQFDLDGIVKQKEWFSQPENGIEGAPADGLWNYVLSDPRFEIEGNSKSGNATNFWVTDTSKGGERWMFKHSYFDGQTAVDPATGEAGGETSEHMHDFMAAELLRELDMDGVKTQFASDPGDFTGWFAQRDWVQEFKGGNGEVLDNADLSHGVLERLPRKRGHADDATQLTDEAIQAIQVSENPSVMTRMMIFDYLINNGMDRHAGNFLAVHDPDKGSLDVGIIDHGLAFGAENDADGTDQIGQSFEEFMKTYRADDRGVDGSFAISNAAVRAAADDATLRQHIEDEVARFKAKKGASASVLKSVDGIEAFTPEATDYAATWLDEFERRLESLDVDDLFRVIKKRGK